MLPDRISNPGPLTYESGALPIALRGPTNGLGYMNGSSFKSDKNGRLTNKFNYFITLKILCRRLMFV